MRKLALLLYFRGMVTLWPSRPHRPPSLGSAVRFADEQARGPLRRHRQFQLRSNLGEIALARAGGR